MKKRLLASLAFVGVMLCIVGYRYKNRYAMSIGIIGGADGPTAIFVAGQTGMILFAGIVLLLAVLLVVCIRRKKK